MTEAEVDGRVERLTVLVCSTCGGKLKGRRCVNKHSSYPAKEVEVIPLSPVSELVEEAQEHLERANKDLSAAMHKGSLRVRADLAERLVQGAKNATVLAQRALDRFPTESTEE